MSSQRPRIGVTAEGRAPDDTILLPVEYLEAVNRAGGEAVPLAPWAPGIEGALDGLDGLLLAGGGDLAPELYGSPGHPAIYEVDRERDAGEIALLRRALAARLPLLCICRGAQLLNVALGGTLLEHLPDQFDGDTQHRAEPPGAAFHRVQLATGSLLAQVAGARWLDTTSWHHQAIRDVAAGLRTVAWAEDGCIEAVEWEAPTAGRSWLLAVQWHPELDAARDAGQQRLFDGLVQAARSQAQRVSSNPGGRRVGQSVA